ncbi:MAG TPA: hypothetical protein DGR97_03765 [Gammaproteobacteria bacterium]|nr:hypothetical protein [Woeseia sp.]HCU89031.1 hypothetical protein [Gammaproteobacteria bacterium]|tara:strand:- start:308 stop:778 length:471 start_codon:yes stop_codon:yes gene_type:complete
MTTRDRSSAFVQIVGITSLIASLIFVGLELRQSHKIALAAQQQERAALITEVIGSFSDANPPISFLHFLNESIDLSDPNTKAIIETYIYRIWMIYENDYLQHKLGLMDEDVWQAKITSMRNVYARCQYSEVTKFALSFASQGLLELLEGSRTNPCP